MRISKIIILAISAALWATTASAATLKVCASGCTYTTVQAAIDAAAPGDTIKLQSGATFSGAFVLRVKTNPSNLYITITTGVNGTGSDVTVGPATGMRTSPTYSGALAKIVPNSNNAAAFRTVLPGETGNGCTVAPCVSSYYKLENMEIAANSYGGASLIVLGSQATSNDCSVPGGTGSCGSYTGGNTQDRLTDEPHHITVDRLYIHGDPLTGQERALQINARDVTVSNNYIDDIKAQADKQGIWTDNSSGNITIINNYIAAAGENFLAGGDVPRMNRDTTVTGTATTTSMTLTDTPADFLTVGMGISFVSGGLKKYTHVTSIAGSVIGIENVGFVPDTGGAVNYSVVPHGLIFRYNHLTKPVAWRNPIVPTPQGVTTAANATGGTLSASATGYSYRVVARMTTAAGNVARSTASAEVSQPTTGSTSTITISWTAVTGATTYYIYGRSRGGENIRFSVTTSACSGSPSVCSFTDTGATGTTEAVPTSNGTVWTVKNLFELKKMYTATIEYNVMEYAWAQAQLGHPILFTVLNNSNGVDGNDSTVVRDITFRYNRVRHATGLMQITGRPADGDIGDRTRDITITQNIFEDIGSAWGSTVDSIIVTTGTNSAFLLPQKRGPLNLNISHNTFLNSQGKSAVLVDLYKSGEAHIAENFDFQDNFIRKVNSGLRAYNGGGLMAEGATSWTAATDAGTSSNTNNVWVGATCSLYPGNPATSFCPSEATFQSAFSNFSGGNYTVTSVWTTSASDDTAVGANPALSATGLAVAETGDNTGGAVIVPPTITTTALPNGTVGKPYTACVVATGGTAPYTWLITSLPAGLSATANCISGNPTTPGSSSVSVKVTGVDTGTSSRSFGITVADVITDDESDLPRCANSVCLAIVPLEDCATIEDALQPRKPRVGDLCFNLTDGIYYKVTATGPTPTFSPIAAANSTQTYTFMAGSTNTTWSMSSAGNQFSPSNDTYADLTGKSECRFSIRTNVVSDGVAWVKYSTGGDVTDTDLGTTAETPGVSLATVTGSWATGTWQPIQSGAKTLVRLGFWGRSPSNATDGAVRSALLTCR